MPYIVLDVQALIKRVLFKFQRTLYAHFAYVNFETEVFNSLYPPPNTGGLKTVQVVPLCSPFLTSQTCYLAFMECLNIKHLIQ